MVTTKAAPSPELLLIRLHYFTWLGGFGFLLPFLGLFYHAQGLTGTQIGIIGTIEAMVALVVAPLWGRWSDRMHRPRRVLQTALLCTALAALWFGRQTTFVALATAVILYTSASSALFALSDALTMNILRRHEGTGFGSIRLWGSFGWALVTSVSGRFLDAFGFYLGFLSYSIGLIISTLIVGRIPTLQHNALLPTSRPGWQQVIRELRHNRAMRGLAMGLALTWVVAASMQPFEAIYLQQLGASTALVGVAYSITAFVEVPGMLFADQLVRRYGPGWMFQTALGLEVVRVGIILLWTAVPTIIGVRVISGLTFSLYSVALLAMVDKHAPGGQSATVLALYAITLRFLVQMLGGPLCGLIFDYLGGYWLYLCLLTTNLLSWFVMYKMLRES